MKIKLAILDSDRNYVDRLSAVFTSKFSDKFEVYSFTDQELALRALDEARIDVFLADESIDIDIAAIPNRCGFAYLVNAVDIEAINGQRSISKFQKVDQIYRQILSIYAEKASSISGIKIDDDNCKTIVFSSPCGGTGTSTVAASSAVYFAQKGNKTLYLNLEHFGSSDSFFSGDGQFDMSDIVFAIKSNKANLSMKLESCVKQDVKGPFFYSPVKLALDRLELSFEDINKLYSELRLTGGYDILIVDIDFQMNKEHLDFYRKANNLVFVGDGSAISNDKISRAYRALITKEQNEDSPLTSRMSLIYNKFSSKVGRQISDIDLKFIGGIQKFENATTNQILEQISTKDFFDKLI